jgi:hypothetical protein
MPPIGARRPAAQGGGRMRASGGDLRAPLLTSHLGGSPQRSASGPRMTPRRQMPRRLAGSTSSREDDHPHDRQRRRSRGLARVGAT